MHWLKSYFPFSTTRDEILSLMIEIWMENCLVSDSNCNIVRPYYPQTLQGATNIVGLTFSVGETTTRFTM